MKTSKIYANKTHVIIMQTECNLLKRKSKIQKPLKFKIHKKLLSCTVQTISWTFSRIRTIKYYYDG